MHLSKKTKVSSLPELLMEQGSIGAMLIISEKTCAEEK